MSMFRAGLTYFVLVFAAGFALGAIRVPFLVPHLGVRAAELLEMPLMLVAIVLAARFVVRRFALPPVAPLRLGVGAFALSLLLLAELSLVLGMQRITIAEYLASRDPVSGPVYLAMLGLFAAMPWLIGLRHGIDHESN